MKNNVAQTAAASGSILLPLVLAQFICSYAATNMNVAVSDIARSLGTTVHGVQIAITFFTLTMAALMIPGSILTDIWGRKFCFILGLSVYGLGALIAALTPSLGILIVGYSLLEGAGSALLIPPVYILITVVFTDLPSRARSFGLVSMAAGLGAATGPLIGGFITTTISWRASFILQVLVVVAIILLARRIADPGVQGAKPHFDLTGAILSAAGLFFVVLGILQSGTYGWSTARENFSIGNVVVIPQGGISPVWLFVAIGAIFLLLFFLHISRTEQAGKQPLLHIRLFRNRTSNLGLVTQIVQWLIMQGSFFVISVYLQTIHHFSAVQAGLTLTAATVGILLSSGVAGRLAKRYAQRNLIRVGFLITTVGMILLLVMVTATSSVWTFLPGLFLMGLGMGLMLTSSVNVVQSSFPERDQGEISGLSRSVSNLGSSLGTAIVGSVLVTTVVPVDKTYGLAIIVTIVISCIGLVAALLLPPAPAQAEQARAGLAAGSQ